MHFSEFKVRQARVMRRALGVFIGAATLVIAGCVTVADDAEVQGPIVAADALTEASMTQNTPRPAKPAYGSVHRSGVVSSSAVAQPSVPPSQLGFVPSLADRPDEGGAVRSARPKLKTKTVDAFVRPLPVPEFVDVVFGGMLETPYVTGPGVAEKTEVVQLRSSGEMKAADFLSVVSDALEQYGVRVVAENGAWQVIEDSALRSRIPRFIKSRARMRTRSDLRPVVQFVELRAVRADNMVQILQQAFGQQSDKLSFTANGRNNFITLAGLPEDVDAALAIIRELDDLNYSGTAVRSYTPRYWNVTEFAKQLETALTVEGWQVTSNLSLTRTISLLPVAYSNDLFIFTRPDDSGRNDADERVNFWIKELDEPIEGGDTQQFFVYQVRNIDASLLAETVNAVLSGQSGLQEASDNRPEAQNNTQRQSGRMSGGSITVDKLGNRILFTGTVNEYEKLESLLQQLDTPAPEVLIEVQIAEVTLTDSTNTGVELLIDDLGGADLQATARTTGMGQGTGGLNVNILTGNITAGLNALASNRRVKVLSSPVLVARSGGSASIQVGTDVPIITSQAAANTQIGGTTDVLQTVAYRKTGVLLEIEPIVFSQDRIDLAISQEVSSTVDVSNAAISSPTISNRNLTTQLSLEDGATAVLGGLIQENLVRDDKGVPFIKDIPGIGQAFSNDSHSVDRTELVMLITAYVLRGQDDKSAFVKRMRSRVNEAAANDGRLITLAPREQF